MPLLLFAFWLILNGKITLEIILVGLVLTAGLTLFARKLLQITPQAEAQVIRRLPGVILYLFYLVWQIILANLQVMRIILSSRKPESKIVWFKPVMKMELTQLTLANSITLTPGTVTASLKKDIICVYALCPEFAEGLKDTSFSEKLLHLEEKKHD